MTIDIWSIVRRWSSRSKDEMKGQERMKEDDDDEDQRRLQIMTGTSTSYIHVPF